MSDRIPYAVGNTNKRDHIQWPTITLAQLATLRADNGNVGYLRHGGCSLASIMALAWRIKRFTFSGDGSLNVTNVTVGGSGAFTVTTVVDYAFSVPANQTLPLYGYSEEGVIEATRENHIVSAANQSQSIGSLAGFIGLRNAGFSRVTGGIFSPPPPRIFADVAVEGVQTYVPPSAHEPPVVNFSGTSSILFQLVIGIFGDSLDEEYVAYDPDSQLFYPYVLCSGLLFVHAGIQFAIDSSGSNGTLTINPIVAPSFTLPLKIFGGYSDFGFNTVNSAAINLTLTADQFWPYANSQGEPVYDSANGAQLNDPLG